MTVRRFTFEERDVEGREIGFSIVADGAVTIELEDGAQIRLKQIVINVIRTNEKTADGERLYVVQSIGQASTLKPATEDTP